MAMRKPVVSQARADKAPAVSSVSAAPAGLISFDKLEDRVYKVVFKNGLSANYHGGELRRHGGHFSHSQVASIAPLEQPAPPAKKG